MNKKNKEKNINTLSIDILATKKDNPYQTKMILDKDKSAQESLNNLSYFIK